MTFSTLSDPKTATAQAVLGVICGEGKLPAVLARNAREQGYKVVALALSAEAETRIANLADAVHRVAIGQLGKSLQILRQYNATQIVFIGKVPKLELLKNIYKLDWIALRAIGKLRDLTDDSIQQAAASLANEYGLTVRTQSEFLRELFPDIGVMTKKQPNAGEYADIQFGVSVAKELARLNIGQTVVVKDQMILAIEAIEGTDETIRRAVKLAGGPVVVVKVAKVGQDQRFDIPTVGLRTLQAMAAPKPGGVLAIAANETMVVEREEMIAFAEENGMILAAV